MPDLSVAAILMLIETLLYSISSMLYLPVLLALVALLVYLLVCAGGLAGEWRQRRRGVRNRVSAARTELTAAAALFGGADGAASQQDLPLELQLERVVQQAETKALRGLEAVRFAVRVGPALGLMGTLIPMGIALAGLAQGNLPQMAQSMVNAFTATVIGLACSVLAYMLALMREHWLRMDMTDIECAADALLARHAAAPTGAPALRVAGV